MGWRTPAEAIPASDIPVPTPFVKPKWKAPAEAMAAEPGPIARINENREGLLPERALAGLKMTPEGEASFLESRYGKGNVGTDANGAIYIKDAQRNEWFPFDSEQFNIRDAADLSSLGVAAGPIGAEAALAAKGVSSLLSAGAASLSSGVLQQGVSAALPGDDAMSFEDRAGRLAVDALAGPAGTLAGRGTAQVADFIRQPINKVKSALTGLKDTPVAREGKALEQYLGEPLTPGQLSQKRNRLMVEGSLRRSPTGASDIMEEMDARQFAAARARFDDLTGRMSKSPADALLLGGRAMQAFDDTLKGVLKQRETQAAADFAAIDGVAGKKSFIAAPSTVAALDDMLAKYDVEGAAGDATKGLVRQLRGLRDAFTRSGGPVPKSAAEFQRLLSSWGRAAEGSSSPFLDVANAEQRGIAKRIFGSLMDDLDAAAAGTTADAATAEALKTARANYRANSQAISDLRKTAVGQYLGLRDANAVSPELLADKLMALKPDQLKQSVVMLERADPELAGLVKRHALERAMQNAEPGEKVLADRINSGMPVAGDEYSPAKLLTNLKRANVYKMLTPAERFDVDMLGRSLARLANRGGSEGSPTAPLMWGMNLVKDLGLASMGLDAVAAARLLGSVFIPTKMAKAIADPAARRALITLTATKPTTKAAVSALETLGVLGVADELAAPPEDVRPVPGLGTSPQ